MKQFDYAMVKDPEYFRDGRLDAHSDHVYYASEEEVWDKETSYRESLNGLWKFQYARNYESAIPGFEAEDYNCKDWEDIYVPAHIQMEDMMHHSMQMCSIRGKDMRIFIRARFRHTLTRRQVM